MQARNDSDICSDTHFNYPNVFGNKAHWPKLDVTMDRNKIRYGVLSIDTIRKMIQRFLEKKMSAVKLAEILRITSADLKHILIKQNLKPSLAYKISLPLIKLYCRTKWDEN